MLNSETVPKGLPNNSMQRTRISRAAEPEVLEGER